MGGAYLYFFESPSQKVLKTVKELATQLSVSMDETPLEGLNFTQSILKKFSEKFEVIVKVDRHSMSPVSDREELQRNLLLLRKFVRQMRVQFTDLTVSENIHSMTVKGKVRLYAPSHELQESPIEFQFIESRGDWLIMRVETFESLNTF